MAYRSINPSTGKIIKTYPNHSDVEIGHALDVAAALYKSDWSQGPIQPRLEVLGRLAEARHCDSGSRPLMAGAAVRRKTWA